MIGAHQVGDMAGELVAGHVIDQQRDRPELLAQSQRAIGRELAAADHLLEAEHRARGDPGEQGLAAARAAEQHRIDRIDPGIDPDRYRGLPQMRRRRRRIEPHQEGPVDLDRTCRIAEEAAEAVEIIDQDAGVLGDRSCGIASSAASQRAPLSCTMPVAKSISARGMRVLARIGDRAGIDGCGSCAAPRPH